MDHDPSDWSDLLDLPGHRAALAELVASLEAGTRRLALVGPAGSGKSVVLRAALRTLWRPDRPVALADRPLDVNHASARLATALMGRLITTGPAAGPALAEALRREAQLGRSPVLAIDGGTCDPIETATGQWIRALQRPEAEETSIPIPLLTRTDAVRLLSGRVGSFVPEAATRVHARSAGIPKEVIRIGELAHRVGLGRGRNRVELADVLDREPDDAHNASFRPGDPCCG